MSDTETDTEYTSKAFPTSGDLARWNALSHAERRDFTESSEQAGFDNGIARSERLAQSLVRVRAYVSIYL